METNTTFETNKMRVMIEGLTYTGSAFGSNEAGDTVFFNQRLVERVSLEVGDIVEAHAIANYEDKRSDTPWRAIRVSENKHSNIDAVIPEVEQTKVRSAAELDQEIMHLLRDDEVSYWTSSDLADAVDADTKTVGNSCLRLFNKSLIAKADVHGGPDQERATFCLWARNVEQFR